ncbi:TetR/AcrR family transcriptional regulator [Streptomyces sp. NRRL WC-3744]|uniref:TetR/AcrR family transcriptional regulator n=1 Tax=Streptomyces sp. NRRL WC-3744 TaxID=1463935 RepID=UPI0004C68FF5|nr:TetR/AcrR family transcriptional regulator [Streptomyces sp. NRRL WC-3744]
MPQVSVKDRLLEHAEDIFRRKGFHAASVQDITNAAGAPKGSFYNHFASKQQLAAEIVHRYAQATDFSALHTDRPALQRLGGHLTGQLERVRETGVQFGCLLGTFAGDSTIAGEEVRRSVQAALSTWADQISRTIEEGQAAGEITTRRPAAVLAAFLVDVLEGALLRAKLRGDHAAAAEEIGIALDALRA